MHKIEMVDQLLKELDRKGSKIDYLGELKSKCLNLIQYRENFDAAMDEVVTDIRKDTQKFLKQENEFGVPFITGISTCIYLPNLKKRGEYKLKIIGGKSSRDISLPINGDTVFDVASITKLFTLILLFKLEELGFINLNDCVSDVNPDYPGLKDFTFVDLIRLHGKLMTDGNIRFARNKEEAYQILKTIYLSSESRTENTYTDFGAIIISDTIEKIMSEKLGYSIGFGQIMERYLLEPLGLSNTLFNPRISNVSGTGNYSQTVHDPKARILGGAVGSAGIFTTSDDLAVLAKNLYQVNYVNTDFLSKNHLAQLGEITFPNSKQSNKGNLGIYVKHPLGFEKTFTPSEFSTGSFSHQGWTGALATFDPVNGIHQNVLVNAIYEDENSERVKNDKPVGYGEAFGEYQKQITKNTMLMYLIKNYYDRFYETDALEKDFHRNIIIKTYRKKDFS